MKTLYTIQTKNTEETKQFAAELAQQMSPGDVITLEGDLGAGKTTFVQGFATGLDVKERVKSPTFTILKIYTSGRLPLYHMDVYRLEDSDADEGLIEYIEGDGITVIEWAQFIEADIPANRLAIDITFTNENERTISLKPIGQTYENKIKQVMTQWGEQI